MIAPYFLVKTLVADQRLAQIRHYMLAGLYFDAQGGRETKTIISRRSKVVSIKKTNSSFGPTVPGPCSLSICHGGTRCSKDAIRAILIQKPPSRPRGIKEGRSELSHSLPRRNWPQAYQHKLEFVRHNALNILAQDIGKF